MTRQFQIDRNLMKPMSKIPHRDPELFATLRCLQDLPYQRRCVTDVHGCRRRPVSRQSLPVENSSGCRFCFWYGEVSTTKLQQLGGYLGQEAVVVRGLRETSNVRPILRVGESQSSIGDTIPPAIPFGRGLRVVWTRCRNRLGVCDCGNCYIHQGEIQRLASFQKGTDLELTSHLHRVRFSDLLRSDSS